MTGRAWAVIIAWATFWFALMMIAAQTELRP